MQRALASALFSGVTPEQDLRTGYTNVETRDEIFNFDKYLNKVYESTGEYIIMNVIHA